MNEKIKQLAKQAGYGFEIHLSQGGVSEEYIWGGVMETRKMEKFTELIVKECIEQIKLTMARDGHSTEHYKQSSKHIEKIKEQFGVEE